MVPSNAVEDLTVIHHQLGILYSYTDKLHLSVRHFQESVRFEEMKGNHYGAAVSQLDIAKSFVQTGHFQNALAFARTALSRFSALKNPPAVYIQDSNKLIQEIERLLASKH